MATIKAGTYRWNDTITQPSFADSDPLQGLIGGNDVIITLPPFNTVIEGDSVSISVSGYFQLIGAGGGLGYSINDLTLPKRTLTVIVAGQTETFECVGLGVYKIPNGWGLQINETLTQTDDYIPFGELGSSIGQTFILETPITCTEEQFTWFTENTNAVEITYKDKVITLRAGQIATLLCANKTMASDVIVSPNNGAAGVSYNGKIIAYVLGEKTAKLPCKDKSPTHDIIVVAEPKPSEGLEFGEYSATERSSVKGIGTCTDTDLVIPTFSPNGYLVVQISSSVGSGPFSYNESLNSVFIPYGVEAIGRGAGLGDAGAFQGCTNLEKVEFSKLSRLKRIWEGTFKDCVNLTSISIPKSVERIIDNAFEGCTKLIQQENGVLYVDKWVVGVDESANSISLRKNTVGIVDNAINSPENLINVDLSSEITKISYGAFSGCENLSSVKIPPTVTVIDEYAFSGCKSLSTITLPEGLTKLGYRAFEGCTNLTCHIVIPDAITVIDADTFMDSGITGVTFPDGLRKIGEEAFRNCSNLTNFTLPNMLEEIGNDAFAGCSSLTSVEIPSSVTSMVAFRGCTNLAKVVIPNGISSLPTSAFSQCISLKSIGITGSGASVEIPDSVKSIGSDAFFGCIGLTSVILPNSVISIDNYAFWRCSGITSITIPDSVTSLGYRVFEECSSLANVVIGNGLTSIGESVFYKCNNLTNIKVNSGNAKYKDVDGNVYTKDGKTLVQYAIGKSDTNFTIPGGVTSISKTSFNTCTNLTSVIISDDVTNIGDQAFGNCSNLNNVVIPTSVTNIERGAFLNCNSLASIKYRGTEEQWNAITKGLLWDFDQHSNSSINYTMTYNYTG